nr:hypothetical protein BaRGS_021331 [Batillaria attramentaria]
MTYKAVYTSVGAIADPKDRASKSCEELADVLPTDVTMAGLLCAASKHRACPEVMELEDKVAETRKVLEKLVISIPSLTLEQEAIDRVVKELEELGQVKNVLALSSLQRRIFSFHTNHGKNIVLSNNQQTAERVRVDF